MQSTIETATVESAAVEGEPLAEVRVQILRPKSRPPEKPLPVEVVEEWGSDVYIAPGGDQMTGSGSRRDPYRCRFVDEVFRRYRGAPRKFRFAAGAFHTRGVWAHQDNGWGTVDFGQVLEGAGRHDTALLLSDPVMETDGTKRYDTYMFWGGHWQGQRSERGCRISGMSLMPSLGSDDILVGGVVFHGTAPSWDDLSIEGVRGRWGGGPAPEKEHFALCCKNGNGAAEGGTVYIRGRASSYVGGIYIGYDNPDAAWSTVRHYDVDLEYDNQFVLAACRNTRFGPGCGSGGRSFFYNDTGTTSGVELESPRGRFEYAGVNLVVQRTDEPKRDVRVHGGVLELVQSRAPKPVPGIALAVTLLPGRVGSNSKPLREESGWPLPNVEPNDRFVLSDVTFTALERDRTFYVVSADAWQFSCLVHLCRLPARSLRNLVNGARCLASGNRDAETLGTLSFV